MPRQIQSCQDTTQHQEKSMGSAGYYEDYQWFLLFLLWRYEIIGLYRRYGGSLGSVVTKNNDAGFTSANPEKLYK